MFRSGPNRFTQTKKPEVDMRALILIACFLLFAAGSASAKIVSKNIEYSHEGDTLMGYLAYDDSIKKAPAVLVAHAWYGLDEFSKESARKLAEMGYVAFALDMYGKGVIAKNDRDARKLSRPFYKKLDLMRGRAQAALDGLAKLPNVDASRIGAMGYCFGGTNVLELARSGADIKGTVSFHGGLKTTRMKDAKNIKGSVLVLHGDRDPFVLKEEVWNFMKEMRRGDVDWQVVYFSKAVHAFTDPSSGDDPSTGAAYNPLAAKRSWEYMRVFFEETLGESSPDETNSGEALP
jgi:dienelactone hydrolase